jgi:hypothetical protein
VHTPTVRQLARAAGVSERLVYNAKLVAREAPDHVDPIRAGELSINAALRVVRRRNGHGLTDAQRRRALEADRLAMQLVAALDDGLTVERAQRLVELWVRHGDGTP